MRRPHRLTASLCIAVIALSAFLPGVFSLDSAVVQLQWVLLLHETPRHLVITFTPGDEQPVALLSLLPSRAPPASLLG